MNHEITITVTERPRRGNWGKAEWRCACGRRGVTWSAATSVRELRDDANTAGKEHAARKDGAK